MINRMNLLRTTALAGLFAVAASISAFATPASISLESCYPGPCNGTQAVTDWNNGTQAVTVGSFDSTLGTLNSVTITLLADVTSSGSVSNNSGANDTLSNFKVNTAMNLLPVGYPTGYASLDGGGLFDLLNASVYATLTASPFLVNQSGVHALLNGNSFTFAVTNAQSTGTYTATSGLGVYETVGAGNLLFPLFTSTSTSGTITGGAVTLFQSTSAYADVLITYNYTAPDSTIPEPASLALLGAGLAGVGVIRRRKAA